MELSALTPLVQSIGASIEVSGTQRVAFVLKKHPLELIRDPKNAYLAHLVSEICPFPPLDEQAELFMALLRANLFGQGTHGAVIAVNRKNKKIYYIRVFDLRRITQQLFVYALSDFIEWLEGWKRGIAKKDYYWPFLKDTLGPQNIGDYWKRI